MDSNKLVRLFLLVLRVALGCIFVYAAWTKLRDPWQLFAMSIDSYRILPLQAVELAAHVIPWLELAVGLLLIAGVWLRISGSIVSLLLLTFFGLMLRAYAKGMEINCGCFGTSEMISWKTLLRDGTMVAAALLVTTMAFLDRPKTAA
jgi:cobalt-zinc-cadmium efflux system protein